MRRIIKTQSRLTKLLDSDYIALILSVIFISWGFIIYNASQNRVSGWIPQFSGRFIGPTMWSVMVIFSGLILLIVFIIKKYRKITSSS